MNEYGILLSDSENESEDFEEFVVNTEERAADVDDDSSDESEGLEENGSGKNSHDAYLIRYCTAYGNKLSGST